MQTLNSIVKIIIENWYLFIAAIAVTAVVSIAIYKFFKQPYNNYKTYKFD